MGGWDEEGHGGIGIGGRGWMSGEGGGHVRVRRFWGKEMWWEGLVGVAGARFRGGGFMWFMPVISVCRDCSEGIGEGGRLASLRERERVLGGSELCFWMLQARERVCVPRYGGFGIINRGNTQAGGHGWGVCLGWQNFEGMYSLRLKHSSSGATVETVSGDFSVGGLRLG